MLRLHLLAAAASIACSAAPSNVTVSLTPTSASVLTGGTRQFAAEVSGTSEHGVLWSVLQGASGGAVDASGLYTAPQAAGSFDVVATSVADPSKSASARITVTARQIAVTISPQSVSLVVGASAQFTATVTNAANQAAVFSVQEAGGGTVTAETGFYTAPSTPGTYHLVATSVADPSKAASAQITVTAPEIAVTIAPHSVSLLQGATTQFTAAVSNAANQAVVFSVQEAGGGTVIADTGVYTAPSAPGTYHVVATSVADSSKSDLASVAVHGPVVTISPKAKTVGLSGTIAFSASVEGLQDTSVVFSVVEAEGGTVTPIGLYTAPEAMGGPYHVKATSTAQPTLSDVAEVTLNDAVPGAFTATGGCGHITLSWADDGSGATWALKRGFQAQGHFDPVVGTPVLASGMWTLDDPSLQDYTHYFYQLVELDPVAGSSAPATADAYTAFAAPTFFVNPPDGIIAWGDTQVSMRWYAIGPGSAAFEVSRSETGSAGPFTVVRSGWPYGSLTDTGLTPSTHYDYRVRLVGSDGAEGCPATIGGSTGAAGSAIKQGVDPTSTEVTESGSAPIDEAFTTAVWYAYQVVGGVWTIYPGLVTAEGRFTFPNVPPGLTYVDLSGTKVYTATRGFDLSQVVQSRLDFVFPSTPTPLTATVSGLQPWTDGDHLQVFSLGPRFGLAVDAVAGATGVPSAAATSASITSTNPGGPASLGGLIEPSKGDLVQIYQFGHAAGAPLDYQTIQRACAGSLAEDMTDGTPATLTCAGGGDMSVPPSSLIHVDWAQSVTDALAAQSAPAGVTPTRTSSTLEIDTLFAVEAQQSPSLLQSFFPVLAKISADNDLSETLTVGNPFTDPRWSGYYQVRIDYSVPYTAAATSKCPTPAPKGLVATFRQGGPLSELGDTIAPEVGVAGEVTLTKLAPITAASPVGNGSPVQVTWSAPSGGAHAPTQYRVDLFRIGLDSSCVTTIRRAATSQWVDGSQTSIVLPPSLFSTGAFVAQVRALWMPDESAGLAQPFQFFAGLRFSGTYKSSAAFAY